MAKIKCNECGKNIDDTLKECPYCGCPIENEDVSPSMIEPTLPWEKTKTEKTNKLICKNCGEEISEKFKVCPYCETKIEKEEVIPKAPVKRGRPAKKKTIICEECKKEIEAESTECPYCGLPIETKHAVEKNTTNKNLITCEECGSKISKNCTECPECGCPTPVKAEAIIKEEVIVKDENLITPPTPRRGRPPKKKETITCKECGFEFEPSLDNCPECGYSVNNAPLITQEEAIEPKPKKRREKVKLSQIFFYIFLILFFIAGCATAVFLYDKTKDNKVTTKKESYKINKTLSCVNKENTEEHNYYFADENLVQYSLYSVGTYSSNDEIENETKAFRDKWEDNANTSKLRFNKKGYTLEKVLVIDLVTSKNIKLDNNINKNDNYNRVKNTMEENEWICTENNKDLGTNLPINSLKSSKEKLEDYLKENDYSELYNKNNGYKTYSKTNGDDENIVINIELGTYTVTETDTDKIVTITYNYKAHEETLVAVENGNTYQITLNTLTNVSTCQDEYWCTENLKDYLDDDMKDIVDDFNSILKKANINLSELIRD